MALITFISDLGGKDFYVAAVKGAIYHRYPVAQVIDITHEVSEYHLLQCAFLLRSVYKSFPKGTVHLVGCDPSGGLQKGGIVMETEGHYLVGADNGILYLTTEGNYENCYHISNKNLFPDQIQPSFMIRDVFAPAAALLASGASPDEIGEPCEPQKLIWGTPGQRSNILMGSILYIDHFGNCITNITRDLFIREKAGRPFRITLRNLEFKRIYFSYADVEPGEPVALFGSHQHLEFAINLGSAKNLLGLAVDSNFLIEFLNA
ncbi:MAG: hypothetical protein EBS07_10590 [Sphingobacteriia bacterium]|nr:hypothetical protein [Sphingobacteriia bacterium]